MEFDKKVTLNEVFLKLQSGQCELAIVTHDEATGIVVSEICKIDGVKCCWLSYLTGSCNKGPKYFVSIMRETIKYYEGLAQGVGCKEVRIGGRNWAKVFPDYTPLEGVDNGLRKVI